MSDQAKRMDLSHYPRRDLPRDETLFFEDEESVEMFVLLAGSLGVFRNEVQVATIDEPLSIIGEMSALTREPRNATIRALSQSKVIVVEDPEKLFADHSQMGVKLARLLAQRLAAMNAQFVEVKSKLARAMFTRPAGTAREFEPNATIAMARPAEARIKDRTSEAEMPAAPATTDDATKTDEATKADGAAKASAVLSVDGEYQDEVFDALNTILDWDMEGT